MAKYTLENTFEFDFLLFSIICHESEYRLCSGINKILSLDLSRDKNLELKNKKQQDMLTFSVFSCLDENNGREYFLLNNLSSNAARQQEKAGAAMQAGLFDSVSPDVNLKKGRLVPELDEHDFLLVLKGEFSSAEKAALLKQLSALEIIRNIKEINPETLASKNNLLF
jgi:hypothetical protein